MVVDYCERKQVNRNKPKPKSSFWLYALFLGVIVGISFGLGFGTAWYLYLPARQITAVSKPAASTGAPAPGKTVPPAPASAPAPVAPVAAPVKGADVPLTFYETLPKGNKSLIGTGLNPSKDSAIPGTPGEKGAAASHPPKSAKTSVAPPADLHPAANASGQGGKEPSAAAKGADKKPNEAFVVQVSSSKERKEAEEIVAGLTAKGVAAYLVESRVEGKGTWYRVRVGKRLSRQDADALAARLGKGSVLIPE